MQVVERDVPPPPVPTGTAEAVAEYRRHLERIGASMAGLGGTLELPERMPVIARIAVDEAGRLWVTPCDRDRPVESVDLFAPDGTFEGTVGTDFS